MLIKKYDKDLNRHSFFISLFQAFTCPTIIGGTKRVQCKRKRGGRKNTGQVLTSGIKEPGPHSIGYPRFWAIDQLGATCDGVLSKTGAISEVYAL